MDPRDSSSENNQPIAGGGAAAEDEGLLNVTYALAKEAAALFQSHKYSECLDVLNQLLLKKPNDPKILHNIAITNFYHNGCSDPKKLLEQLDSVKRRSEDLACASVESADGDDNMGSKANSTSKGTNITANQSPAASNESIVYTDEFDSSVALLNIAIIWFHLHEYSKALTVLEPLYLNIEPLDEKTARRICLLLLDVALASQDASRSADVLSYLETASNVRSSTNLGDSGNTGQQQSLNLEAKSISLPISADGPISESSSSINVSDNTLSRTLSEETDYENLLSTLDIGGDHQGSGGLSSSNDHSRMPVDHCIPAIDHRLNLQLNKIRFLLLTRNVKSMKREVKEAMNLARGGDSTMALLLKSQFEYARGNHRKAIKLLIASNNRNENVFSSICNNNFGCIYYQLGKPHTSSLLLSRALSDTCSLKKDNRRNLLAFSQDKSFMIVYNCGLQYLACGKPVLAARCFHKASLVFYNRPLLWLRISECCLMAVEKGLLKTSGASSYGSEVKALVIGKGKWRHLVLEDGFRRRHDNLVGVDNLSFSDDKQLTLSLPLAHKCLLNALHLLNGSNMDGFPSDSNFEENLGEEVVEDTNHRSSDSKMANVTASSGQVATNGEVRERRGGGQSQSDLIKTSLAEYEQICKRENLEIKQALLANLAFVELELQNPLKALSTAKTLLKLEASSRIYIFLGHVYAAEALCRLNRPKDAAEHLSTYLSGESKFEFPYREEDCEKWKIEKVVNEEANGATGTAKGTRDAQNNLFMTPEKARDTLYVNLAVTCAVQGDHEQAHKFATQALSTVPNSYEAILTVVYLDLMLGKTQEALAKLKSCDRVAFLPFRQ